LVYNTGTGGLTPAGYYYWDGSKWVKFLITGTPSSDAWLTTGNSGTSPSSNFIGTIDNTSLVFRTNNTEQMRLHNTGQLSIGDNTPGGKLDVHQTSSNDVARFTTYGNVNSILLRRTQGTKTSPSPTSGANTVLGRFDAQGYDGSGFTSAARIEMATDATGGTSSDMPGRITFSTTPDGSGTLVERMRITNNGDVGIGTAIPSHKLEVIDTSQSTSWVVSRFQGRHPSTSHFIFQNQNNGYAAVQVRGTEGAGTKYINFQIEPNGNDKGGIFGNVGSFYLDVGNVGIGTTTPNNRLVVLGGSIVWGNSSEINFLQNDQGGSIELGGTTTIANPVLNGTPYIDFHYGTGVGEDFNVRIINMANNRLDFATNSAGTVMSINGSNVGIGTTGPGTKLDINIPGTSAITTIQQNVNANALALSSAYGTGNLYAPGLVWYTTDNAPTRPKAGVWIQTTPSGSKLFAGTSNNYGTGITNTALTIDQNGNVGIGTTNPTYQLDLSTDNARKLTSNTWFTVSDERLKNITGKYSKGLKEILQLNPITYYYKNTSDFTFDSKVLEKENIGFSAQQVSKIFPEAVSQDPSGYLSFNIHPILVAYVNAIKEQQAIIESQKNEIELLKKKSTEIDNLKAEIDFIKSQLNADKQSSNR
jgi:hypothetical protein